MKRRDFIVSAAALAGAVPLASGQTPKNSPSGKMVLEPARKIPVAYECDVCVLGGSCTGVFAAVAAARRGAKVALVERNGFFGGVATAALVNIWHSLHSIQGDQQVIGGLTVETMERLRKTTGVPTRGNRAGKPIQYVLNTEMLKMELDKLVIENGIRPFLYASFAAPAMSEKGEVDAAFIEDKSGRRAIRAKVFIDATGDADLIRQMELETYRHDQIQPPTMCCVIEGLERMREKHPGLNIHKAIFDKKFEQALPRGFSWGTRVPGLPDHFMLSGTRVFDVDCSDADELTQATIEGRRQVRQIIDLLQKNFAEKDKMPLAWLPASLGVRESVHARCLHQLTAKELLTGVRFPDAIANGTYPLDIHSTHGAGIKFQHLPKDVPFYQIPYRSLVPRGAKNVLVAGRNHDAEREAFGATRVMVNCNQMGEAAGTAAFLALNAGQGVADIDTDKLRELLNDTGAIML